jgi:hypothetical protein
MDSMSRDQILFTITAFSIPFIGFVLAAWMDWRDAKKRK